MLFTLLTGQPPFTGNNGFAVVQRKMSEQAPSVSSLRPDLPPAVVQLVDELLRRDPDQRPQKAAEVQERIARLRYGSVDWELDSWISFLLYADAPGRTASIIAIPATLILALAVTRAARRPRAAQPWSLRIGPEGITTADASGATASTGPSGRRTFGWNHIKIHAGRRWHPEIGYLDGAI